MITIDCTNLTPAELHREIAQKLSFPHWYGKNLDALYDCLTETEAQVCLVGCTEERFCQTFLEAAEDNPFLTVTFQ